MAEHNVVLETGYEYDENGNVCGNWGQEVCSKCGCRTDLMDSPAECPAEMKIRVFWSSEIPISKDSLETYEMESIEQAKQKLEELTQRDLKNKSITDNIGGIQIFEDDEWVDWEED